MQIEPRSRTVSTSSTQNDSAPAKGESASVVDVQRRKGRMTLLVGGKRISVPLQAGLKAGDRVTCQQNEEGRLSVQKQSPDLARQAVDTMRRDALEKDQNWAPFLDRWGNMPQKGENSNLLMTELRSAARQFSTGTLSNSDVSRIFNQVSNALLQQNTTEARLALSELEAVVGTQYPEALQTSPLALQGQTLLDGLAANDFSGAATALRELSRLFSAAGGETAVSGGRDLQVLTRLLQPLQELDSWGSPSDLSASDVRAVRQGVERELSLPLDDQARNNWQTLSRAAESVIAEGTEAQHSEGATVGLCLKVVSLTEKGLLLQGRTSEGTQQLQLPLQTEHPLRQQLRSESQVALFPIQGKNSVQTQKAENQATTAIQEGKTSALGNQAELESRDTVIVSRGKTDSPPDRAFVETDVDYLPTSEVKSLLANKVPITANLVDAYEFAHQYADEIPSNRLVQFAQVLHQLDLQLPHGATMDDSQKDLALRWLLSSQPTTPGVKVQISSDVLQGLTQYQVDGDREGELFQNLSEPVRKQLLQEMRTPGKEVIRPADLEIIADKISTNSDLSSSDRDALSQLRQQSQWTRLDQDTRHSSERQEVFYFQHEGVLHKGRIQFRHEQGRQRGAGGGDSTKRLHVETSTANLGNVQVDFQIQSNRLELIFSTADGKAEPAVQEERPSLAKALDEIGYLLGDLSYRVFVQAELAEPQSSPQRSLGLLDLRA
ncbi:MAG TPA: hypothetical protein VLM37_07015 [Fibrobacteraceae bacterium]|nr:hypothetical protein [Fibrobacteraceae bacterium]